MLLLSKKPGLDPVPALTTWTGSTSLSLCPTLHTHTCTMRYNSTQGVRISRDPIAESGGINLYGYCLNDPVNFVDPLGLDLDLNRYSTNDSVYPGIKNVKNSPDTFEAGGHGSPNTFRDDKGKLKPLSGPQLDASSLAKLIKSDPNYKSGMTVKLISCSTGKGDNSIAQQLADELGAEVIAPDDYLWVGSKGGLDVYGRKRDKSGKNWVLDKSKPGTWQHFKPRK